MKLIRHSMTALTIAISLAACGDDNEKKTPANDGANSVAKAVVAVPEAPVEAPVKAAVDESFKAILAHVPADTAFLITNKKAFPKEMLEFHLMRSQQAFSMWDGFLEDVTTKAQIEAENKIGQKSDIKNKSKDKKTTDNEAEKVAETDQFLAFVKALLTDVRENLTVDKLANTGIKADGHSALYAVDLVPVVRYEVVSKDAVIETIKRAEKASGYKVDWKKCGDFQCIEKVSETGEGGLAIVLMDNQVAMSLFPLEKKVAIVDHLIGKSKPKKSYTEANWNKFLSDNNYQGYGDGYVNLKKTYDAAQKFMIAQAKNSAEAQGDTFDEKATRACIEVGKRHFNHMPEALFGITALEKKSLSYEMLLKTSPAVSSAIQAIPNPLTGLQKAEKPIFDLGLNINIGKLREGLTQYTNFLVKTAEELKCDAVKPEVIRKGMGSFAMASMMGADKFKAVYFSINDLTMGAEGQPEKIEALLSVVADNPTALLQMMAMTNPAFASLQLPKDGSAMKLPADLIPPNPTGVTPDVYLSQKEKVLTLMVGNDKPAVKPFKTKRPAILWSTVDSKRYYGVLGDVIKKMPGQQQDEESKKALGMMTKLSDIAGEIYTEVGADDRGISVNYSITYK